MYRYLVVKDAEIANDVKILMRSNDKESVERLVQRHEPNDIKVYQLRYVAENVLCAVGYEDESDQLDTLSDVTRPATDDEVLICGCSASKKRNDVIGHPYPCNRSSTVDA